MTALCSVTYPVEPGIENKTVARWASVTEEFVLFLPPQ